MVPARTADHFAGAFTAADDWGADALLVPSVSRADPHLSTRVVEAGGQHRLAAFYEHREFTDLGGLATYGPNYAVIYQRAAAYVDSILKGANRPISPSKSQRPSTS